MTKSPCRSGKEELVLHPFGAAPKDFGQVELSVLRMTRV